MDGYYREIFVWKNRNAKSALRFTCLQDLETGKFTVQSADFFYLPLTEKQVLYFGNQFLELFVEASRIPRSKWYLSLQEAILAHPGSLESNSSSTDLAH